MENSAPKYRKKKKLGSYPYASVVFSITMALTVMGLFGLLMLHVNKLRNIIEENVEMQVYLNKYITEAEKQKVQRMLASRDYVLRKEENAAVQFISKEEAAAAFIEDTGEDFLEFLGENPLRDAYVIRISRDYQDADRLQGIKEELEKQSGVFEVTYVENMITQINKNMTTIGLILAGFAVVLLLVVIILINNTIKLALFSQRFLIRSMQLVGAKAGFIRKPFLTRATLHGFLSGLLACGLLAGLLWYANERLEELRQLQEPEKVMILFGALLVLGALIGFLSTLRAMNKYLRLSLDELY